MRKEQPGLDLPIAVGIVLATGGREGPDDAAFLGELALDGTVRHVPGALVAATWARERHLRRLFVPARDAAEAALGSGALTTAEAAIALGKTVLAVPGSVFSALSVGCHRLLRDGAGLVQNARDVLQEIGEPGEVLDARSSRRPGSASRRLPWGWTLCSSISPTRFPPTLEPWRRGSAFPSSRSWSASLRRSSRGESGGSEAAT